MQSITTTDFSKFGYRERKMAEELLHAWNSNGLPDDFYNDQVTIMFNTYSGNVFLTNAEYQVAMMNGDQLESFYTDFETGEEGFKEELSAEALERLGFNNNNRGAVMLPLQCFGMQEALETQNLK